MEEMRNVSYTISEGKRPLGRLRCRWEDIIKMYVKNRMGGCGLD
jgi:hypothetical protein